MAEKLFWQKKSKKDRGEGYRLCGEGAERRGPKGRFRPSGQAGARAGSGRAEANAHIRNPRQPNGREQMKRRLSPPWELVSVGRWAPAL